MRSLRTARKSSPHLPQLEKARVQQQRPNTAKNTFLKIKKIKNSHWVNFHIPASPPELQWAQGNLQFKRELKDQKYLIMHPLPNGRLGILWQIKIFALFSSGTLPSPFAVPALFRIPTIKQQQAFSLLLAGKR